MKKITAAIIIAFSAGCLSMGQTTDEILKDRSIQDKVEDGAALVKLKNMEGTVWVHRPFKDFPNCVDTLNFQNDSTGYEYRCEFEIRNNIKYNYENDTLEIYEYGHISEVKNLGQEVKNRWRYVYNDNKLKLVGYAEGIEDPIVETNQNITYKLLKSTERQLLNPE